MTYDARILVAPFGQVRLVTYFREGNEEFVEMVGDFPRLSLAFRMAEELNQLNPDPDGMRRSHAVLGIFNDRGSVIWTQQPTKWPGDEWNKKEHEDDILPAIWKNKKPAQSLTY